MVSISDQESGVSVRSKLNTLFNEVDALEVVTAPYATRAAFVAADPSVADGTVFFAGGLAYEALTGATQISDLSGWIPHGKRELGHWGISSANTAAVNTALLVEALEQGGNIRSGVLGTVSMNNTDVTLTADLDFEIQAGTTFQGASGLATEMFDFSGSFTLKIHGAGVIDNSLTTYTSGAASGSGIVLDAGLERVEVRGLHFYAAAARQATNGDAGISGTADDVLIEGCKFEGQPDLGIYQAGSANDSGSGFYDGDEGGNWRVIGNTFIECAGAYGTKRNAWTGVFANNWIELCDLGFVAIPAGTSPNMLAAGKGGVITGNYFKKVKSRPIELRNLGYHTISGNIIQDFGYGSDALATAGTDNTAYGIWIRGGRFITGGNNQIFFKEWTSTSSHSALYVGEYVYNTVTYEPEGLDISVSLADVHTGVLFDASMTGAIGAISITTNTGFTNLTSGTIPDNLTLTTKVDSDVRVYQNGAISFRIVDGEVRAPTFQTDLITYDSREVVSTVTSGSITVTESWVDLDNNATVNVTDIVNGSAGSGSMGLLVIRNPDTQVKTFVHDTAKLRLIGATNVALSQHETIIFMQITSTVWQQIGGKS